MKLIKNFIGAELDEKGYIKLPPIIQKNKEDGKRLFVEGKAVKISQFIDSDTTPLKCSIRIEVFPSFNKKERIKSTFKQASKIFEHFADLSFKEINENLFEVTIISGKKRCSWCNSFIKYLGSKLDIKIIKDIVCQDEYSKSRKYFY